ncbi:MAG TPA: hypothetical protein VFS58_15075 [Steroidobacteraceae bacterium]|nr:hypothetical protein [Steroidobacteraceae bacterium]
MTGPGEQDDDASDESVRTALRRSQPHTSSAHDAVVLAAATRVAGELRARSRSRWLVPVSLAASVALLSVWTIHVMRDTPARDDTLRGATQAQRVVPADAARLAAAPIELHWEAVPGASSYEVTLRNAQGAVLGVRAAGGSTTLPFGQVMNEQLETGTYFWAVRARGPALDTELGPFSFSIIESLP